MLIYATTSAPLSGQVQSTTGCPTLPIVDEQRIVQLVFSFLLPTKTGERKEGRGKEGRKWVASIMLMVRFVERKGNVDRKYPSTP